MRTQERIYFVGGTENQLAGVAKVGFWRWRRRADLRVERRCLGFWTEIWGAVGVGRLNERRSELKGLRPHQPWGPAVRTAS